MTREWIRTENHVLSREELETICFQQLGRWPSSSATADDIRRALRYEAELPPSVEDEQRKELTDFITENRDRLSLPCNGDCYAHPNFVVRWCYEDLKEALGGEEEQ